ncbi:MAG: hypothetical protein H8E31_02260 [Planctomycetes bacterium]|nr:hypothetical protein [Planctomycetota bacterium]
MKIHASLLLCLAFTAASCSVPSEAAWSGLHFNAYGGMLDVSTEGTVDNVKATSGGANVQGDVDLGAASDSVLLFGGRAGVAPFELVFSDLSFNTGNPSVFAAGGTFAGNVLTSNLRSTTTVDMAIRKMLLGIDVFATGVFRLGLLLGVDEVSFDELSVTADQSALLGAISPGDKQVVLSGESVFVPMVGARADIDLPSGFRVGAELTGVAASTSDVDVSYFDFDGSLNYAITDNIEALLGYRYITINVDGSFDGTRLDTELDITGPYIAVGIVF